MVKKIILLFLILIGGLMLVITIDSLGVKGNGVMHFMGAFIFISGMLISLYISIQKIKK